MHTRSDVDVATLLRSAAAISWRQRQQCALEARHEQHSRRISEAPHFVMGRSTRH